ncbi:MAG: hypothetical protein AAF842_09410 [Planctomycetota bacterium]
MPTSSPIEFEDLSRTLDNHTLEDGGGTLVVDDERFECRYKFIWKWVPDPGLELFVEIDESDSVRFVNAISFNVSIQHQLTDDAGLTHEISFRRSTKNSAWYYLRSSFDRGELKPAKRLEYLVSNGPKTRFDHHAEVETKIGLIRYFPTQIGAGSINQNYGHFGPTHWLHVELAEPQAINLEFAQENLFAALSFIFGVPASILGPMVFDNSGQLIFSHMYSPVCHPRKSVFSWVSRSDLPTCFELLSKFPFDFEGNSLAKHLYLPIFWYANHNLNLVDNESAVITGCAALDSLAWHMLTQDSTMLTPNAFKKLSAAERTRLLATHLQLPIDIPAELNHLEAYAKSRNLEDATDAIHNVRNAIVHPEHKAADAVLFENRPAIAEAWQQIAWFIETFILRSLAYSGGYIDRRNTQAGLQDFSKVIA